ncbi:MAG TPA: TolC family protein [Polyangia bacterium]|nr:TolC family protein [Polyangia bacterium]
MSRPFVTIATALSLVTLASGAARAAPRALTIDDAVALALRTNPRLVAARQRAEASDVNASSVTRRMLPAVHVTDEAQLWNAPFAIVLPGGAGGSAGSTGLGGSTGAGGMMGSAPAFVVRNKETNTFVASFDQPLLGLFRANDERETLTEQSAGERNQIAAAESDIRQAVETQFLQVFEAQALEQIASASVRELSEQVTVAKARLASGVITNADLLRIEVAVANAEQQGLQAHSQGQTARAQLFAAIGVMPGEGAELTLVAPATRLASVRARAASPSLAALLPQAQAHRPELKQQEHLVLAADHQVAAKTYALFPDIDLEGAYIRTDGQLFAPPNQAYLGLKATWAVWEWGASNLQRKAAALQADAARRDQDVLARQIEAELTASLAQGDAARGAVDTAEKAVASAEEAYRVTDAALKAGAATTTDLLESESALTQARLNLTRAEYDLVLSDVAMAHATGAVGVAGLPPS